MTDNDSTNVRTQKANRPQAGFGLIEILVALALGLLVIGGVLQVFTATNQSNRSQQALARVQETGRFVLEYLKPRIRLAGRMNACVATTPTRNHLDPGGTGYVSGLFDPTQGFMVWEYVGSGPNETVALSTPAVAGAANADKWKNYLNEDLPTAIANLAIEGSDIFVIRYAEAIPGLAACNNNVLNSRQLGINVGNCPGGTPASAGYSDDELEVLLPQGGLVYVTDCNNSDLFQRTNNHTATSLSRGNAGGNLDPGNTQGNWSTVYDENAQIFTVRTLVFYVGLGTGGEPALFQIPVGDDAGPLGDPVELAQGVESVQILMGLAAGQTVGYFEPDNAALTPTSYERVVGTTISFLIRSPNLADENLDAATYNVAASTIDPINDNRMRKVFSTTISIRNGVITVI